MTDAPRPAAQERRISEPEFVALIAVLYGTIAFSIDSMLPALPAIAEAFTPDAPNRAQLVIAAFLMGMGLGTIFAGPLSDSFGRKPTMAVAIGLYLVGALAAVHSNSLEMLLAARVVQGLGAAGPRIVAVALVRDLYSGREMARIISFVMTIFVMIPSVAPLIGTFIIEGFGWRGIFWSFVVFGAFGVAWLQLRQPETLPAERRRPLNAAALRGAFIEVARNRMVRLYIAALSLGFGQMFALIVSTQQIYFEVYDRAEGFPYWFALCGFLAVGGTLLNAVFVMRFGMRRLAMISFASLAVLSLVLAASNLIWDISPGLGFAGFFLFSTAIFFFAGLTFGNLNALALQPLGHVAGMAASIVGAVSTVFGALIAVVIGLAYDGSIVPITVGATICSAIAWGLVRKSREEDPAPYVRPPAA